MSTSIKAAKIVNVGYEKTRDILVEKGYEHIRTFEAKLPRGYISSEDHFEVWAGGVNPHVTLILQVWKDGNGVHVYSTKGVGYTYDDLKAAL